MALIILLLLFAPTRWPIQSLSVEGNHNYTREQILTVAGLKVGQMAGKDEFDAARDRLVATGAFEEVGYKFAPAPGSKGYAASFQIVEVEQVYPVRFENLGAEPTELNAYLKGKDPLFGAKAPGTTKIIERYAKLLGERAGFPVAGKLVPDAADQFTILFRPAKAEPVVADVKFEGNQVIPSSALLNAFSAVAFGTPYTEKGFRQLLDSSVRPLYEARGRIQVAFPVVKAAKAEKVEGVSVTVTVDEGPSFELGEVKLTGNSGIASADLQKTGGFKTGDLANFDQVNEGLERMKKRLRRAGYMRANAKAERQIDDKLKKVDLLIHVDEGPQFLFGALNIQGLDLNGEAAIRKLWALKEGKPFNADYPDFFLSRIREDQVFEALGKTRSILDVNEQNRVVNVTVEFQSASKEPGEKSRARREGRGPID